MSLPRTELNCLSFTHAERLAGAGVDVVSKARMGRFVTRYKDRLNRIFYKDEIAWAGADPVKYAMLFCAKEAVFKALPQEIQDKLYFYRIRICLKDDGL